MPKRTRIVIGGVDNHGRTHHAAVLDTQGRLLGDREFPADHSGYRRLLSWLSRHGQVGGVGVEGTGSYGAGLTHYLGDQRVRVVEVDRPDRRTRRQRGRSDPIDAEAAARAVLAGTATAVPKRRDGIVEAIRVLRTARRGASKARTAAINQLKALVVTAPAPVREALEDLSASALVTTCARLRPNEADLADPLHASKAALQAVAKRIELLEAELELADQRLAKLVGRAAPRLLALLAIGNDHAGQLLVTAGQHPERLRGEAAFAHLCGVAPIPASSGKTRRHRLHRGGDRDANRALHLAVVVRMRFCPAPAPMSNDGPKKASPNPRSCAASSATWPARSTTPWSPTSRHFTPLDDLYEHPLRLVQTTRLLTLAGSSLQMAPDGCSRIVWMIIGMIKAHPMKNWMACDASEALRGR